jgi:predicted metal-binding protein
VIKYKVTPYDIEVREVECVSETEKTVLVAATKENGWSRKEHREAKVSEFARYFNTREDAVAYLIERTKQNIRSKRAALVELEDWLAQLEKQR